ncbi:sulfatase-like hydrolase/transferase [Salinirubrum litoreum]|uniref:Sulfatase-like hydrolase/transferase n=1 Tax=Salinirubrum litoreum TaxID=1126234 RepID=A0ABD5R9T3_9EURY|nr:sulfatase-like hydrolase/transferase [Salinirubrum litoreum]
MSVLAPMTAGSVENVYVFVCDALRRDELPESVADLGVTVPTLANALCTPQSMPTILTGLYPPNHGVDWFDEVLSPDVPTLFDADTGDSNGLSVGYDELVWKGSSVRNVLDDPPRVDLSSVDPPFVAVEHDHGGHTPYPGDMERTTADLLGRIGDTDELRRRYREGVAASVERFHDRMAVLDDRGLLDETLVLFTSDHGELLGEHGGFVGHQLPVAPEVVHVPTVAIHEGLPAGERRSKHVSHVDFVPTIADALTTDTGLPTEAMDGVSLFSDLPRTRLTYTHALVRATPKFRGSMLDPIYDAPSVWSLSGGRVVGKTGPVRRSALIWYEALRSNYTAAFNADRNPVGRLVRSARVYGPRTQTFGTPEFSRSEATELIETVRSGDVSARKTDIDEETRRDLEDLGYV